MAQFYTFLSNGYTISFDFLRRAENEVGKFDITPKVGLCIEMIKY